MGQALLLSLTVDHIRELLSGNRAGHDGWHIERVRSGDRLIRALDIARHRGRACDEWIVPYTITAAGLHVDP
jgi:hypothetical protein